MFYFLCHELAPFGSMKPFMGMKEIVKISDIKHKVQLIFFFEALAALIFVIALIDVLWFISKRNKL